MPARKGFEDPGTMVGPPAGETTGIRRRAPTTATARSSGRWARFFKLIHFLLKKNLEPSLGLRS
jgi:hypothetical protein